MSNLICNICNKGRSLSVRMNEKFERAKEIVKRYGQEHLLKFYDEKTDEEKEKLLDQILSINFDLMEKLYENAVNPVTIEEADIEPIDYVDKSKLTATEMKNYEDVYKRQGL